MPGAGGRKPFSTQLGRIYRGLGLVVSSLPSRFTSGATSIIGREATDPIQGASRPLRLVPPDHCLERRTFGADAFRLYAWPRHDR